MNCAIDGRTITGLNEGNSGRGIETNIKHGQEQANRPQAQKAAQGKIPRFTRWLRNAFWYFIVALAVVAYQVHAPLDGWPWWLGLIVLAGVLQIFVSKLRERLRF